MWTKELFGTEKPIIALLHLDPLPGDPDFCGSLDTVIEHASCDVKALQEGGVDGVLIANEFSFPMTYVSHTETLMAMACVIGAIKKDIHVPFGTNVVMNPEETIRMAKAVGASFGRSAFAGAFTGTYGVHVNNFGENVRLKYALGIPEMKLLCKINPEGDVLLAEQSIEEIIDNVTLGDHVGAFCCLLYTSIRVFGKNLVQLLLQPPIVGQVILGWDPAFRTGCKLAVVDPTGKVLDTTVIYPTAPQNKVEESKKVLKKLIEKYHVTVISLGNGTASRESEQIIVELLKEIPQKVSYVIVNEAGASVYSASKLATEEFPNFDVGQRSAASIARRLQDPLAELVKIDPKSIGVGQYQHDMNQKKLDETLQGVVEDSVNKVGVDLNTASASLLSYISGINKTIAKNIVAYREENGVFTDRRSLKKVPKLGPKAYEQCAGFLRVRDGSNPLDMTSVHPESYKATEALLKSLGYETEDVRKGLGNIRRQVKDKKKTAEELGIGIETLTDILKELEKPGRDPREEMPKPVLRTDVMELKDLKPGMILKGTVRNVIDFGAFVDIGVHQDGLVHISQICDRYISHPLDAVSVGDIVQVKVLSVDPVKKKISLTMKLDTDVEQKQK